VNPYPPSPDSFLVVNAFFDKPQSPLPALAGVFCSLLRQPLIRPTLLEALDIVASQCMMSNSIIIETIEYLAGKALAFPTM
jgi:hypothetical protein